MRKLALLSLIVSSAISLAGQQSAPPAATLTAAPVTVIGCVVGLNGGYSLNAASGKTFTLSGDNLQNYSGQKVRALGTMSFAKKSGSDSKAEPPTLNVTKIDKLADTCSQ